MAILLEHWKSGVSWLSWNFLGMLGLWGAGALAFSFLSEAPWLQLIDRGQLFLYSVGILAQAMYILVKERRITTLPNRPLLIFLCFLCFVVSALFYGGTVLSNFADSPDIVPQIVVLRSVGLITLAASMVVGVWVTLVAEERQEVDLGELSERNISRLGAKASSLLDKAP